MSQYPYFGPARPQPLDYEQRVDVGVLARFFNAVYAWMAAGLAVTALVAWWVASRPDVLQYVFSTGGLVFLIIAELALVLTISAAIRRIGATTATVLFLVYAALNGLTLSAILLHYAHAAIASAFIVTAGMFAAASIYGFVTKRDLTSFRGLLFMGVVGIFLALVVTLIWHNTVLTVLINFIGVFIFLGLTAYDTQKLKQMAVATQGDAALAARLSITGALALYLDFLNLFLFMLRILSDRNR
jgi:FtsH-binding integral membrane protein